MNERLHIIFVSYYFDYFESSLRELITFTECFNCDYHIFIVNNNKNNKIELRRNNVTVIPGTNKFGEFSGWNEGLEYAKKIDASANYIFLNDTFNHHRKWMKNISDRFLNCFKKVFSSREACIGGELNNISSEFSVYNLTASCWISTYLFALNKEALNIIKWNITPENNILNIVQSCKSPDEIYSNLLFSPELKIHVNNWLSPVNEHKSWYGVKNMDDAQKMRKIKAIFFEKYFSANAVAKGIKFIPIRYSFLDKLIYKFTKF